MCTMRVILYKNFNETKVLDFYPCILILNLIYNGECDIRLWSQKLGLKPKSTDWQKKELNFLSLILSDNISKKGYVSIGIC